MLGVFLVEKETPTYYARAHQNYLCLIAIEVSLYLGDDPQFGVVL